MPVNTIVAFAVGLLILWILCKILSFPVKVIGKLIVNALVGAVVLFLFNLIGGFFGLSIPINALSAIITGILGVPGVILLLIFQMIL
ncbi:MAG: pro-sigmaK processing inhibitor BofA family protein [Clostridia bacterium]|nr:pro-sigmaK processing inhibitor BofA family protein [Clostridia bacterium]MBQ7113131.1 pro-sigmaK processing inhibitor BofA family protein [Clostridia bacterium]